MQKYYVLYSAPHSIVAPSVTRTNGEVIPERVFHIGERAVYRLKGVPSRFYRRDYPSPGDNGFFLAKFRSLMEAVELRDHIDDPYFNVYEWVDGQLGEKVEI